MKIFKEYVQLFANTVIFIGIIMASFLLLINIYHYSDISQKYVVDLNESKQYKDMKKNISKSQKVIDATKENVKSGKYKSASDNIYNILNQCIITYKDSKILGKDGIIQYDYYDVYKNNEYLYNKINGDCIAMMSLDISKLVQPYPKIRNSYNDFSKSYLATGNIIVQNSDYLKNKALSTNSYSFTSDISKLTVFNDLKNDGDLTIRNYKDVSDLILDISNWYSTEFGGVSNE